MERKRIRYYKCLEWLVKQYADFVADKREKCKYMKIRKSMRWVYFGWQTYRQKTEGAQRRVERFKSPIPWLMDFISIVLGIFSWAVASTDLRLTLDLNSVFIRVDFPRPLCPVSKNTASEKDTHTSRLEENNTPTVTAGLHANIGAIINKTK